MDKFAKVIRRATFFSTIVVCVFLLILAILTTINVIVRGLGGNILGNTEISVLLAIIAVSCAFAYTTLERGHISVTMLVDHLSKPTRAILEIVTSTISLAFIALIIWGSIKLLPNKLDEQTFIHHIPILPFRIIFVLGLILFCLVWVVNIYERFKVVRMK
jgi:TRAP-type C4-dicarboxylate transport system permease small subunit